MTLISQLGWWDDDDHDDDDTGGSLDTCTRFVAPHGKQKLNLAV